MEKQYAWKVSPWHTCFLSTGNFWMVHILPRKSRPAVWMSPDTSFLLQSELGLMVEELETWESAAFSQKFTKLILWKQMKLQSYSHFSFSLGCFTYYNMQQKKQSNLCFCFSLLLPCPKREFTHVPQLGLTCNWMQTISCEGRSTHPLFGWNHTPTLPPCCLCRS